MRETAYTRAQRRDAHDDYYPARRSGWRGDERHEAPPSRMRDVLAVAAFLGLLAAFYVYIFTLPHH